MNFIYRFIKKMYAMFSAATGATRACSILTRLLEPALSAAPNQANGGAANDAAALAANGAEERRGGEWHGGSRGERLWEERRCGGSRGEQLREERHGGERCGRIGVRRPLSVLWRPLRGGG